MARKPNLAVFAIFVESHRFAWRHASLLLNAALLPYILGWLLVSVIAYSASPLLFELQSLTQTMTQMGTDLSESQLLRQKALLDKILLWILAISLVMTLASIPFYISCQRLVLRGAERYEKTSLRLGKTEQRYGLYCFLFLLLGNAPNIIFSQVIGQMAGNSTQNAAALIMVGSIACTIMSSLILVKLMVILPAYALDLPLTLKEGWQLSRSQGWALLVMVIMMGAPAFMISLYVTFLIGPVGVKLFSHLFTQITFICFFLMGQHFLTFGLISIALAKAFQTLTGPSSGQTEGSLR